MNQKLNRTALDKILADIDKNRADIAQAEKETVSLKEEIDGYLRTVDPHDAKAVQVIAGKKIMLEMMPHMITRAEKNLGTLKNKLSAEILLFEQGLCEVGADEHIKLKAELDRRTAPFFPGGEMSLASVVNTITSIPIHSNMLAGQCWELRLAFKPGLDDAISYAREIMGIYEQWKKDGGKYRPAIWESLAAA